MNGAPHPGCFRLADVSVEIDSRLILSDVEFSVEAGEAVAIVGPSGAGKTTLLRLLNGMVFPSRGLVNSSGLDLNSATSRQLRRLRSTIGFVHQDHNLIPNLRVIQNVVAGKLGQRGFFRSARSMIHANESERQRVYALLGRVGIADKLYQRTDTLSGGQKQRVALARALFQEPKSLLADEPVASVDPARARDLIRLMCDLAREDGLTLIVCLHDLSLAREFFPRTIGLRAGRLMFDSTTSEVSEEKFAELYRLEST